METWEHLWKRCRKWKSEGRSWHDKVEWVLGDEGERDIWIREVEKERGEAKESGRGVGGESEKKCEGESEEEFCDWSVRLERTRRRELEGGEEERMVSGGVCERESDGGNGKGSSEEGGGKLGMIGLG